VRASTSVAGLITLVVTVAAPVTATAHELDHTSVQMAQAEDAEEFSSDNLSHVTTLPYEMHYGQTISFGTDIEFADLDVYAGDQRLRRVDGPNRMSTAAAVGTVSRFETETVVIATAREYADALAGAPLAVAEEANLLLSDRDGLSPETLLEIDRSGAQSAILLGGEKALSPQVVEDLEALGTEEEPFTVERIGGEDRFETAGLILDRLAEDAEVDEVVVVEGIHADPNRGWPDAISASGLSGHGLPILLVRNDSVPAATADRLGPGRDVVVLGGPVAVSAPTLADLDAVAGEVRRVGGNDRYETSVLAAEEALERGASASDVWLATGRNFPDGLAAGTAAGTAGGVLALIDGLEPERSLVTTAFLANRIRSIDLVSLAGGPAVITEDTRVALRDLLGAGAEAEPRSFAVAGTYENGLQLIDITDPENPSIAGVYECAIAQGDVQVFTRDGRTYATYTADDISGSTGPGSSCYRDLRVFDDGDDDEDDVLENHYGTFIADITNPYDPESVGFAEVVTGSHNMTVHPSGEWMYNSNSDLIDNTAAEVEIYDIRDLGAPEPVDPLELPLRPGLGTQSHDITFNTDGTRAYSAAISQTVIIDTTDPGAPEVISSIVDPSVNVEHQSDPITLTDSDGNERDFVVVSDELAGAAGNGFCPGGGLHLWDVTGEKEQAPEKVGTFFIPDFRPAGSGSGQGESITCTAHVFRLHPEQGIMTIAWYNAGVWVVDITGLADASTPLDMPFEVLGWGYLSDSDTWSVKTPRIEADGSMYLFANDIVRGFDVWRFDGTAPTSEGPIAVPLDLTSAAATRGLPALGLLALVGHVVHRRREDSAEA
jgi:putative cell wall-binding protein